MEVKANSKFVSPALLSPTFSPLFLLLKGLLRHAGWVHQHTPEHFKRSGGPANSPYLSRGPRAEWLASCGADMIDADPKRWRGDLTRAQRSPRTSPGSGAPVYKQCHIHGWVTCSVYSARAGRLPHKRNIIPRCVRTVFSVGCVFSFMLCPH